MATNQLQSAKARYGIVGSSKLLDAALETTARVAPTYNSYRGKWRR
ncbi:MAG: hypothetical protein R2778_01560 [Saprospiraceae bacterium]